MRIDKKTIGIFLIGLCFGIASVFIGKKMIHPFIDTKERSDYAGMNFLKNKIISYKKYCGHYPNQKDGLSALLEKDAGTCFPIKERMDEIPKNSNDESFLYFENEDEFFIVNPLNKEMYISSKTIFP